MPLCLPCFPPITNAIQVMDEHRRAMLTVATALYDKLFRLAELGPAVRVVQRAYRAHMGRGLLALSKHQVRTTPSNAPPVCCFRFIVGVSARGIYCP